MTCGSLSRSGSSQKQINCANPPLHGGHKLERLSVFDDQKETIKNVGKALRKFNRVILQGETGSGKTRMAKWMLGRYAEFNPMGKFGFFVQRRGLVDNASREMHKSPTLDHAMIMAGRGGINWDMQVHVASIDTLNSWFLNDDGKYTGEKTFDFIVTDEVHAQTSKFIKLIDAQNAVRAAGGYPATKVLGLTATPQNKHLAWFDTIVSGPSYSWLQRNGRSCPYKYVCADSTSNNSKLVRRGRSKDGEYTEDSVADAFAGMSGHMIRDWVKFARHRKTIAFFPRRKEAIEAAADYAKLEGVVSAYIDGNTPDKERDGIYRDFQHGKVNVLCNVGVIERGTDLPRCDCVQLCVCIAGLDRFRQIIGRGSRIHDQVSHCLVIDHGHNVMNKDGTVNHGFMDDVINWSLDDGVISVEHKPRILVKCKSCGRMFRGGKCPTCSEGAEPTEVAQKEFAFNSCRMTEINPKKVKRTKKEFDSHSYMVSQLFRAARNKRGGGMTVGQAIKMAKKSLEGKPEASKFCVPKTITDKGGNVYKMPDAGSPESKQPVSYVFEFTNLNKKTSSYTEPAKRKAVPTSRTTTSS